MRSARSAASRAASSQAGDELPVGERGAGREGRPQRPGGAAPRCPGKPAELRVLPGLYWHRITEAAGQAFFEDTWKVAPEADRIGYRFRGGRPLEFVPREPPFGAGSDPSNIVDACYPYGSIQVPGGTEPIVLHRDAVSGGGYFMIGTVISRRHGPDRPVAAQQSGAVRRGGHGGALKARAEYKSRVARLTASLRQ